MWGCVHHSLPSQINTCMNVQFWIVCTNCPQVVLVSFAEKYHIDVHVRSLSFQNIAQFNINACGWFPDDEILMASEVLHEKTLKSPPPLPLPNLCKQCHGSHHFIWHPFYLASTVHTVQYYFTWVVLNSATFTRFPSAECSSLALLESGLCALRRCNMEWWDHTPSTVYHSVERTQMNIDTSGLIRQIMMVDPCFKLISFAMAKETLSWISIPTKERDTFVVSSLLQVKMSCFLPASCDSGWACGEDLPYWSLTSRAHRSIKSRYRNLSNLAPQGTWQLAWIYEKYLGSVHFGIILWGMR